MKNHAPPVSIDMMDALLYEARCHMPIFVRLGKKPHCCKKFDVVAAYQFPLKHFANVASP